MKRTPLAAFAAVVIAAGIWAFQFDSHPLNEVHAENAPAQVAAAPAAKPLPYPSVVEQDAPYH